MTRLKKVLLLLPVLLIFIEYPLFMPFKDKETTSVTAYEDYTYIFVEKVIPLIGLFCAVIFFTRSGRKFRFLFIFPIIYFIYMVFESLYLYNSFFQFPHVFLKISNLGIALSVYLFYQKFKIDFQLLFYIITGALLLNILFDPGMISLSAFINHERGLSAASIYLLLLPCLYFLNSYLTEPTKISLTIFLLLLTAIFFFQHRTVWVTTFTAFIFNVIFVIRQRSITFKVLIPGFLVLIFLLTFTTSLLVTFSDNFSKKITDNIAEIINPQEDRGTSGWRIKQMETYWPFVKEHLVAGMRLKGFELPMQRYDGGGQADQEKLSGHHFHSFYYDLLFYFGIIGLIIFLIYIIYPINFFIKKFNSFSNIELTVMSFVFSGLIYGIAYNLPIFYWTILGLFYAIIESKMKSEKQGEQLINSMSQDAVKNPTS